MLISIINYLYRIVFKILTDVFKCTHNVGPSMLSECLSSYCTSRPIRSSSISLLDCPISHSRFSDRAFSVAAPRLWNGLPGHIRGAESFLTFKKYLKSYLFQRAFLATSTPSTRTLCFIWSYSPVECSYASSASTRSRTTARDALGDTFHYQSADGELAGSRERKDLRQRLSQRWDIVWCQSRQVAKPCCCEAIRSARHASYLYTAR